MEIWTKDFWIAAVTRAIRTTAQVAVCAIGTNAFGITQVDWAGTASLAVGAGILSLLMAVGGLPEVKLGAQLAEKTNA